MKTKMCLLAVALLLTFSWNAASGNSSSDGTMPQSEEQVSGVVIDEYGPVAGAAIKVKDLLIGTVTDADGKFSISLPEGAVLVVSFLGYQDKEVAWHGEDNLTIRLEQDAELLDEVQAVAAIMEYRTENPIESGASGWYLPSIKELSLLFKGNTSMWTESNDQVPVINESLAKVSGAVALTGDYWSSTETNPGDIQRILASGKLQTNRSFNELNVRPVMAF